MVPTRFVDPLKDMDRLFESMGQRLRGGVMPMDAFERAGLCTLRFDLAGVDPDDVDITVESGTLTVTAPRPTEDNEGVNWLVRERPTGIHSREVRLGDRLDVEQVGAEYRNGVLPVTIPIRAEAQRRRIPIAAGGPGSGDRPIDVEGR